MDKSLEVVAELKNRGIAASFEYPGVIELSTKSAEKLVCGTINGVWACDVEDFDGQFVESVESTIEPESDDVKAIADFIACTYTTLCMAVGQ